MSPCPGRCCRWVGVYVPLDGGDHAVLSARSPLGSSTLWQQLTHEAPGSFAATTACRCSFFFCGTRGDWLQLGGALPPHRKLCQWRLLLRKHGAKSNERELVSPPTVGHSEPCSGQVPLHPLSRPWWNNTLFDSGTYTQDACKMRWDVHWSYSLQ